MNKKQITTILTWSTIALIVPTLGQLFVNGWNWGPGDFLFAWVFFNILGLTYVFARSKISNPRIKIVAGIIVILFFASIWVMLATG